MHSKKWMALASALWLAVLMTLPGIALFYGGMVRRKSVLNVMACVMATCAIVSLLWVGWFGFNAGSAVAADGRAGLAMGAAVVFGLVAGAACYGGATALKRLLQADDSLDVFGVHGVGGIVGSLLWLTSLCVSLRVSEAEEIDGLDITQHAERLGA